MQISEDDKQWITDLLQSGDKLGAVRYIQETLSLSAEDALTLAEKLEEQELIGVSVKLEEGPNPARIVGVVFSIIGFILLTLAFIFGYRDYQFATTAIPVTGKVSRIETRQPSNGTPMYSPVITYVIDGAPRDYASPVSSSGISHQIGEEVELLVDPNDPSTVTINSFFDRWFLVSLLGGLGLVFSVIGYIARRVMAPR